MPQVDYAAKKCLFFDVDDYGVIAIGDGKKIRKQFFEESASSHSEKAGANSYVYLYLNHSSWEIRSAIE